MDKATDYLLIQENSIAKLNNSIKLILPNVQSSLLKMNTKAMKVIASRLPKKSIKNIERDAIRQIPGFKKDFFEAKTKLSRSKIFDGYTQRPAAIAVALVSSTTKHSVSDVIKTGEQKLGKIRIPVVSEYLTLIKLGLFASFILAIFVSDGAVIIPTIQLVLRSVALLFSLISSVLSGTALSMDSGETIGDKMSNWWDKQWTRPPVDIPTQTAVKKMGETPPGDSIMPHDIPPPVEDLSFIEKFLHHTDPLGLDGPGM